MTTRRILKKLVTAGVFLPMLLFTACMSEELDGSKSATDKETAVTFSLQLPGTSKAGSRALPGTSELSTRALSETDENEVKTIEVLQFESGGGKYIRTTFCTAIVAGGDSRTKTFTVKLIKGTYDLMILANPRPRVKAGYTAGDTRQTVMDALYADLPAGDKWNADPTSGTSYSPIPMWGEVNAITIADNTSLTGASAVQLTRMVAKVNVQVSGTATSKFLLKSVRVYNYNSRGNLVPAAANWNGTSHIATAPTVPAGSDLRGNPTHSNPAFQNPLLYNGAAITTTDVASEGEIYLFESEVGSATTLSSNTCLVIGGNYDGSGTETYYRVDFANKSGNAWNYLPLLRNHKYLVDISTVSGKGFDTPIDAFNSAPVNIEANVLEWNDGSMSEVVFDGQNMLSVSKGIFDIPKDADSYTVDIKTDVTTGWKATAMDSWITFPGDITGPKDLKKTLTFNVTENTTGAVREGKIKITAGRLEYIITVTQSTQAKKAPAFTFIEMKNVDGTGTSVPLAGGTITAKVNTNMGWELKTDKAGLEAVMAEPTNETPDDYTLSITIPQAGTGDGWANASTTVWVEYNGIRFNQTTYTQTGYNITVTGAPTTVNKYGEDVTLNLNGYFPAMKFRAVNATDASKVLSDVVTCTATGSPSSDGTSTVTLSVYTNSSGTNRNVKFQYEKSTGVWVDITTASQEWNGLYLPTAGVLAPPNILGVGAETGKLTLGGSKEYPGGIAGETVYIVYFKWGSTVAISAGGGSGDGFDLTDIAWVPKGFVANILDYRTVPCQFSGAYPIQNDPTGLGDPCSLAVENGTNKKYRLPTGYPYEQFIDGGWVNNYSGVPGRWSDYGGIKTQFYPACGYRNEWGIMDSMLFDARYMTSTPALDAAWSYWTFIIHSITPYDWEEYADKSNPSHGPIANAIRCIKR